MKKYKNRKDSMLLDHDEILGNTELPLELQEFAKEIQSKD